MSSQQTSSETEEKSNTGSSSQQQRLDKKQERAKEQEAQAAAEAQSSADEETTLLKVFRYDPEVEAKQEPQFDDFHVPYEKGMTVLDALIYARDHFDSSLTFRHSCQMAVCGSDGLFINGSQRLGCQTQISAALNH